MPGMTTYMRSVLFFLAFAGLMAPSFGAVLLSDDFNRANGLVTNEYAYWNPTDPTAVRSSIWNLDSGSLFIQDGAGWTGVPNDIGPDAQSSNGNNSAIFRLNTIAGDFEDVAVSFQLLNQGLSTTPSTPAVDWDGIHIWLRYQTEYQLYYCSINRRDNNVVIKKKVPGGPSNGGTYYELSPYTPFAVPYGQWQNVTATVKNNANGSVTFSLYEDNVLLVAATDDGSIAGPPLRGPGKVGIRGDNANLKFKNFQVASLDGSVFVPPPLPLNPNHPNPQKGPAPLAVIQGLDVTPVMSIDATIQAKTQNASSLQWKITANGPAVKPSPGARTLNVVTANGSSVISTLLPLLPLQQLALQPGSYRLEVTARNADGVPSAPFRVDLTLVPADSTAVRVFPNPWRADRHGFAQQINFDRLIPDSTVNIFTLSGHKVKTLVASTNAVVWDLTNDAVDRVGSGVYIYSISSGEGKPIRGKLAVVR